MEMIWYFILIYLNNYVCLFVCLFQQHKMGGVDGLNASAHFLYGDGLVFHEHWHQYSHVIFSIPDYIHYTLGIYISIVCIIGTMANALVIYLFAT